MKESVEGFEPLRLHDLLQEPVSEKISFVTSKNDVDYARSVVEEEEFIGIDCEWSPIRSSKEGNLSLIQVNIFHRHSLKIKSSLLVKLAF